MKARIFQPSKTPMQSGLANTQDWILEIAPETPPTADPLTGWTSSSDTTAWQRMFFASLDQAIGYAKKMELDFIVEERSKKIFKPKSYADNFRIDRRLPWTH